MNSPDMIPQDHVIVVFGANGDLSRRKILPALYHLTEEGLMPERFLIIGNSRSEMSDQEFRDFARDAVDEFCRCEATDATWEKFSERLSYEATALIAPRRWHDPAKQAPPE